MDTKKMTIIAVDDEPDALAALTEAIKEALPMVKVAGFGWSEDALNYAKENQVDVAFLDINMGGMNGLTLAKKLKDIYGKTNIVFVTGYDKYAIDAMNLRASGYILKPPNAEQITIEMENLWHPIENKEAGVKITCFGSFGVFINGKPLIFTQAKSKELLALLVHKQGVALTNAEIASVLWENKEDSSSLQSQVRKTQANLIKFLNSSGISDIICKARNSMAVDISKFACDYYDYLKGDTKAVNTYMGEYLSEYSWAEFTTAWLNEKRK